MSDKQKLSAGTIANALQWLCVTGAVWFIMAFLYVALSSMRYPFNLEWMEGQSIDIIQRILDGKPVYAKPSLEYVAYIYTPLYFYVSAFVAYFTGVDFFPARLVSIVATLGSTALIYAFIYKEKRDWKASLIGAGLFLATYRLSGRWFDNSRVDSLFVFLMLAGLYVFWHRRGWPYAIAAAFLLAAAFFTKQSALIVAAPVLLWGVWIDRRHTLQVIAMFALLMIFVINLYDFASNGWFSFFVFKVPAGHGIDRRMIWDFWKIDLWRPLNMALFATVISLVLLYREHGPLGMRYGALVAGGLAAGYIARLHGYGYVNVLMPLHAIIALVAGLALSRRGQPPGLGIILGIAVLAQMNMLAYHPRPLIPGTESVSQGEHFLRELSKVEGDVFIPELQFVQTRIGKKSYTLGMAAFDILRADLKDMNYIKKDFMQALAVAVASGRFSAIMPGRMVPVPQLESYYRFRRKLEFPKEYVTGAINFLRPDLFVSIRVSNAPAP